MERMGKRFYRMARETIKYTDREVTWNGNRRSGRKFGILLLVSIPVDGKLGSLPLIMFSVLDTICSAQRRKQPQYYGASNWR